MDQFTATEVSFNNGYQAGIESLVGAIERSKYCQSASEDWPMLITMNNLELEKIAKEVIDSKVGVHA
jgi:hypothetical protein